jgi:hypothetical protein
MKILLFIIFLYASIFQAEAEIGAIIGSQISSMQRASIGDRLIKMQLEISRNNLELKNSIIRDKFIINHYTTGRLNVWDFSSGALLHDTTVPKDIHILSYDANSRIIYGFSKNAIMTFEASTGRVLSSTKNSFDISKGIADNYNNLYIAGESKDLAKINQDLSKSWQTKIDSKTIKKFELSHNETAIMIADGQNVLSIDIITGEVSSKISGGISRINGKAATYTRQDNVIKLQSDFDAAGIINDFQEIAHDSIFIDRQSKIIMSGSGEIIEIDDGKKKIIDTDVVKIHPLGSIKYLYVKRNGSINIREFNKDRRLLSIQARSTGWVAIDHEGRYDGTTEGIKDVTWRADNMKIPLEDFFTTHFQPGILANYVNSTQIQLNQITASPADGAFLPPKVEIDIPKSKMIYSEPYRFVVVTESLGGNLPLQSQVFHNGKRIPGKSRVGSQKIENEQRKMLFEVIEIFPTAGPNEIFAEAINDHGIKSRSKIHKEVTTNIKSTGNLRVISVGIDEYKLRKYNLDYAKADAMSISNTLKNTSRSLYANTEDTLLSDRSATKTNILNALGSLSNLSPNDTAVVVLAGHGTLEKNEWYFLPHDMSPDKVDSTGISAKQIEDFLINSPAKKIMLIIDACNSGGTVDSFNQYQNFQRRFVQQIGRTSGVTVLTATRRDQLAVELSTLGHGLFSYLLLEGLSGKADNSPMDKQVTAHELAIYVGQSMESKGAELAYRNLVPVSKPGQVSGSPINKAALDQRPSYFIIGSDFTLAQAQ